MLTVVRHEIVEAPWLPHELPPVLLKDWPGPGEYALLVNPTIPEGETAEGPDHLDRHDCQVVGPVTPADLVAAVEAAVGREQIVSGPHEEDTATRQAGDVLAELLDSYGEEALWAAVTDHPEVSRAVKGRAREEIGRA